MAVINPIFNPLFPSDHNNQQITTPPLPRLPKEVWQKIIDFTVSDEAYLNHYKKEGILRTFNNSNLEITLLKTRPKAVNNILRSVNGDIEKLQQAAKNTLRIVGTSIKSLDLRNIPLTEKKLETLVTYFPNLESLDRIYCSMDEGCLKQIVKLHKLTHLALYSNGDIRDPRALLLLRQLQGLISLTLDTPIGDRLLDQLAESLPNLQKVHLGHYASITANSLTTLERLHKLESLTLNEHIEFLQVNNDTLERLTVLQNIKMLTLQRTSITDNKVELFSRFPALCQLNLSGSRHITNNAVDTITTILPNLTHLRLEICSQITGPIVQNILRLRQLEELALPPNIQTEDLSTLARLPKFERLDLLYCETTDATFEQLAHLTRLTILKMELIYFSTDKTIEHLICLKKLKVLYISSPSPSSLSLITDMGVQQLVTLTQLEELSLTLSKDMTPQILRSIACLEKLRMLNLLGHCNVPVAITGHTMLHELAALSNLTYLSIHGWEFKKPKNYPFGLLNDFSNAIYENELIRAGCDLRKQLPSLEIATGQRDILIQLESTMEKIIALGKWFIDIPVSLVRIPAELSNLIQQHLPTIDGKIFKSILHSSRFLCDTYVYALSTLVFAAATPIFIGWKLVQTVAAPTLFRIYCREMVNEIIDIPRTITTIAAMIFRGRMRIF